MIKRQQKPNWDFALTRVSRIPKPRHIPKREVMSSEFALVRKHPYKPLPVKPVSAKPAAAIQKPEPVYQTMAVPRVTGAKAYKPLLALISFALIIILVVQSVAYLSSAKQDSKQILGAATSAYADLDSAAGGLKSQNFADAEKLFQSAQTTLSDAGNDLDHYWLLTKILPQAKSADKLLEAAQALASGGQSLSSALGLFDQLKVSSTGVETKNFAGVLTESDAKLKDSLASLEKADSLFGQATSLPKEYQPKIAEAKLQIATLTSLLKGMVQVEDLYLSFLGNQTKTYFIAFQNYDELRATGGFIGTYGVLKISKGQINELKIESIYNLDGSIYGTPAAPGPFQPDIAKWGTRDANFFADFPTSAKKILNFYEKGKETADGVIAITPKFFVDLLRLTGPIEMPAYDTVLTADNFQEVVQLKTSVEYDKKLNKPKQFLSDFAPLMLNRLQSLTRDQWLGVFQIFNDNLFGKNLMLYSTNADAQNKIVQAGVSGSIIDSDSDYLNIVNSNQGGTKTDLKISQQASLESTIHSDGSVENHLTITRINGANLPNTDFMRIMLPLGSKLISAEGFDDRPQFSSVADGLKTDPDLANWDKGQYAAPNLFQRVESGKTEFTGWVKTEPVNSRTVKISYILPFKVHPDSINPTASYGLTFQKQPGATDTEFSMSLSFAGLKSVWSSPEVLVSGNTASLNALISRDRNWSVLLSE